MNQRVSQWIDSLSSTHLRCPVFLLRGRVRFSDHHSLRHEHVGVLLLGLLYCHRESLEKSQTSKSCDSFIRHALTNISLLLSEDGNPFESPCNIPTIQKCFHPFFFCLTWCWSTASSPVMMILFSILVSEYPPLTVYKWRISQMYAFRAPVTSANRIKT